MRHALGIMGVLAAGVLLAVSAAMNWRFGLSLGMTEFDGQIYGAASAAADCMKALIPFFLFAAIRNRMWSQAAASALVWVVVTGYSLTSAFGHAALNRDGTAGQRVADAQAYKDLRGDLKRAQDQLSWVPQHRPAQAVHAEIDGMKIDRGWKWTRGCTRVKGKYNRNFCDKYHRLVSELASAEQAASLETRIASIQSKIGNKSAGSVMSEADPQAAVLAKLTGLDFEKVQMALTVFIALLLEIGSGLGLYVAFSQWRLYDAKEAVETKVAATPVAANDQQESTIAAPVPVKKETVVKEEPRSGANDNKTVTPAIRMVAPESDVQRFYREAVGTEKGSSLTAKELYQGYQSWCKGQGKESLAMSLFHREFREFGVKREKVAGKVHYRGIALTSAETSTEDKKLTVHRARAA